ncbi:MAG TPA: 5-formyltetrahydrofolate cyclo-ligase [Mycobacteriales bacterium]|jgi:5-formyltetrahydrofolate cyclo-ligase|nr:5-formyltetrahydrofolate cyclo-ligase [Mycobacteriales bacterium]
MVRPAQDLVAAKQRIRAESLAQRATRSPAELADAGQEIAGHGIDRWLDAGLIAAYLSVGTEPATRPMLDALTTAGVRVVVPVIVGKGLDWADYLSGCEVSTGALGVAEPTGRRLGPAVLNSADVILVPALAVDRDGNRLGRGRGYYDRALAGVTAPAVAVVYDEELLEAVPAESHDHRMQGVLRPAGYVLL